MSSFIPMVSASPPPFDDHSFGYDDEDDFGTFTGADDSHESSPGPPEPPPIGPDSDSKTEDENSINNNPDIHDSLSTEKTDNEIKLKENSKPEDSVNGTNGSDDFANFEQYESHQGGDNTKPKPHIENLPIQSLEDKSSIDSSGQVCESKEENGMCERTSEKGNGSCDMKSPIRDSAQSSTTTTTAILTGSRDSTTDSGMFSTDISPVPRSEDTADLCDKSSDSDNDCTFPDLPKDKTESTESLPTSDSDHLKADEDSADVSSETRTTPVLEVCDNGGNSSDDVTSVTATEKSDDVSVNTEKVEEANNDIAQDAPDCVSVEKADPDKPVLSDDKSDDWGEFDFVGKEDPQDLNLPEIGTQSESSTNTKSEMQSEVQSEDECIEAIEEALKDSDHTENLNDNDLHEFTDDEDVVVDKPKAQVDCEHSNDNSGEAVVQANGDSCDSVCESRTEVASDTEVDTEVSLQTHQECDSGEITAPTDSAQSGEAGEEFAAGEDEEEWNAFGEVSESGGGGDNWADFQDFQAPPPAQESEQGHAESDGQDDFGDFNTANKGVSDDVNSTADDDWADFEESEPGPSKQALEKSDSIPAVTSHSTCPKVSSEKVEQMLCECFPSSECQSLHIRLEELLLSLCHHTAASTNTQDSNKKPMLWGRLRDLDKTHALAYQWSPSAANTNMFKTLHIDTQNILFGHKKQSVPLFAANIGLLEPIRGSSDARPSPPKPHPTLVDPDKTDGATPQQELPPVQFDWDNSGLTNPLAAEGISKPSPVIGESPDPVLNNSMSKTLDLDFLSVQETESVNKNTVFQSEILDAPRSSVKSLPPLEDILKNMKTTTTTRRRPDEHLSEEASRVIDSLPILSFMTSKVLMFPLRQANE